MIPALSQVCSLNSPFEQDIEEYAAGKCAAVELWLGKLEAYLDRHSVAEVRELLAAHAMSAPVASYQGGLFVAEEDARRQHWDHFARRLQLCAELGVGTLVVAADLAGPLGQSDLQRVRTSLREAATAAEGQGVRLALEFQAQAPLINNLQTAVAMVAECGSPALGICLDVFHYQLGPSKQEDLAWLTSDNLFHVQLADLAGIARELATDADRILPGDGDFLLEPIVAHLRAIDYQGAVSVELMNPQIWRVPARQFGEVGITALRSALGLAAMQ